jgi:hypothetical protein
MEELLPILVVVLVAAMSIGTASTGLQAVPFQLL